MKYHIGRYSCLVVWKLVFFLRVCPLEIRYLSPVTEDSEVRPAGDVLREEFDQTSGGRHEQQMGQSCAVH